MQCAARTLLDRMQFMIKLTLQALNSRVSCVSDRARAARGVTSGLADGIGSARVHATRVPTRAIVTLVRVTAVTVRHTGRGGGHCKQTCDDGGQCAGDMLPLGLHSPLGPMNVSSGHVQRTVLMGELFATVHVCVG